MKTLKVSFDFTDVPDLVELLRLEAATTYRSQKGIVVEALQTYFSNRVETTSVYKLAEKTFAEWACEEDSVYDKL